MEIRSIPVSPGTPFSGRLEGFARRVAKLRAASGVSARAVEFAALTTGAVRGAVWDEVDLAMRCGRCRLRIKADLVKASEDGPAPLLECRSTEVTATEGEAEFIRIKPDAAPD